MAEREPICSICLETFKEPTTIPCNHVFCSLCLQRHEEENAREGWFACPLCNREVKVAREGPCGIKKEATDQRDVSNEVSPICDICGQKISATNRCLECEENYCQVCSALHIKMKASRNHTLRELGVLDQEYKVTLRRREFCPKHPEEEIKIVCKTCSNMPLCLFCKISEHDCHKSRMLEEELREIKSDLESNLALCLVRLDQLQICTIEGEAFDSKIDQSEQEEVMAVNKQEQELIRLIEDQKLKVKQEAQTFKDSIRKIYKKVRNENDDCKRQIAREVSDCANLCSKARILIDTATEYQIVQIGYILKGKLLLETKRTRKIKLLGFHRRAFTPAGLSMQKLELGMGNIATDMMKEQCNVFLRPCVKEGRMQLLEIEPSEKVSELKKRVTEKYSLLPGTKLILTFDGKDLNDCYVMKRYGISNGSIIECAWSQPPQGLS